MKAVPIFLLVEGITYLITNFKELSEGTGILAKVLQPVGDLISWITDGLYALTDAIGLTNSALDEMGETVVKNADATKEALGQQTAEFDRQMKVAKAAGQSTVDIEKAKQQAIIDTNVQIVKQIEAFVRAGGVLDDEKKKLLTASLETIKNAVVENKVIEINAQKESNDQYKKHLQEKAALDKAYNDEFAKRLDLTVQSQIENEAREKQALADKKQAELDSMMESYALGQQELEYENELNKQAGLNKVETAKWTAEQEQGFINQTQNIAAISMQNQANLANFLFDLKRSKLEKGSAEELKVAKKQFQINKALAIQSAVISGIQGVVNALSAQSVIPEPYGTILKVITAAGIGVAAGVNVAKIASQQFNESGGGGGQTGTAAIGTGGSGAAAPTIQTPNNTVTKIDDAGKVAPKVPDQKVYVTEGDISTTQKRVKTIEEAATL
jgi:hypothetical protein